MTVSSVTNRVSYTGNGSTTAFAFSHPFRLTADLVVTVRTTATGAESLKTEGSDYTVTGTADSGTGGYSSGTVTFSVAPATGTQVHIDRVVTRTQTVDLIAGDGIPPASVEGALDKLSLSVQELDARFARTLLQPRTAANRNLVLPEPSSSASDKILGVNTTGTAYELKAANTSATTSTISYTQPLTGGAARTLLSRLSDFVSVKDFGATGNGSTDDYAAIQAAITASAGKALYFPPGVYKVSAKLVLADYSLSIVGAGTDLATLFFSTTSAGIEWSSVNFYDTCEICGIQLIAGAISTSPAISVSFTPSVGTVNVTSRVEDVLVSYNAGGGWPGGVYTYNSRICIISRVSVIGLAGTTVYGVKFDGNSTDVRVAECQVTGATNAIYKSGTCEGLHVHGFLCIAVDKGIYTDHAGGEPGLYVSDSHFNCNTHCFDLTNVMQATIVDCLLYGYTGGAMPGITFAALAGADTKDIIFSNVIFHGTSYTGSKTGISLSTGLRIEVMGCKFLDLGTAISAGASSSNCAFALNRYSGVTTRISDSGTSNVILELDAIATGTGASLVNKVTLSGAATGSPPSIAATGTDTNIDLTLTPKGTGNVRFGTLTASGDAAVSGYITIKDAGGTTRKLAVIT